MPLIKPKTTNVEAPPEPHLALLTESNSIPVFMAIPPNAIMAIVKNPHDPMRGIFPITPVRITEKRLEFKCPCGQSNCTRKVVFNATWSGTHPAGTNQISTKGK